ncbi:MAG: iron export ABC transporter permease subunit FetB [Alphaproteobacteria bacterium]|nr:iron export ABC transporter permease subunit FetB [Alphaproteobacteria bacterium]
MNYVSLDVSQLALAASLILINGAISWAFALGLERTLLVNAVRMTVQLTLIGFVLKWIFAQTSPLWTLGLALIMMIVAGYEIVSRLSRRPRGFEAYLLGSGTLLIVGTLATVFTVAGLIGPEPWYAPRYVLPILGMVLGNAMTGIALTTSTLLESAVRDRTAIEARLALGHDRFTAFSETLRLSLKTGLMPIVNAMAASGIVALPGMMTGQILAGLDPIEATKYQIMIMFVIAGATALGVVIAGYASVLLITDARHRLRLDRLHAATKT